jgi:hydrogenase maturation protease
VPRATVIGVGNPDRGDDGAGIEAARRVRALLPPDIRVVECGGDMSDLVELLSNAGAAVLIDACVSGAPAGTVRRLDVGAAPVPVAMRTLSSHGFGLAETIELVRALGKLPERCILYAIEGETFDMGARLSASVLRGVDEVVAAVERDPMLVAPTP